MSYELVELKADRARQLLGFSRYGYTPQTALADLLDNSLAFGANRIDITIAEQLDGSEKVYISDNGRGITKERLPVALALGSPAEIQESRLSKFGFGMKTASLENSPSGFSIVSRSEATGELVAASLLQEDQKGSGLPVARFYTSQEDIDATWISYLEMNAGEGKSGTTVIWESADLREADRKGGRKGSDDQTKARIRGRIADYLGLVFHRWIEGNVPSGIPVKIFFQGEEIEPWNPLLEEYLDPDNCGSPLSFEVPNDDGEDVELKITPWVMKKGVPKTEATEVARKNSTHQGIYLYRMDRIINTPNWLGIGPKRDPLHGLRFALELDPSLDDSIHLDVKKSTVIPTDEILDAITPMVERYRRQEEDRANRKQQEANRGATPFSVLEEASSKYKEADKEAPSVRPERSSETEVITTNADGQRRVLYVKEISSDQDASQNIHLVPAHETGGHLWETRTSLDGELHVYLNEEHEFYVKVIQPSDSASFHGFLWLILAHSRSEFSSQYSEFKLQFSQMRRQISDFLEFYAADLELPVVVESE